MKEFNESNVTAIERLDDNYGGSEYMGVLSQQNHNTYKVFYDFLKNEKPKQILEIGTGVGGFAHALGTFINDLDLDTRMLTFDINPGIQERLNIMGVDARVENIFDPEYTKITDEVVDFIQKDGVTIVLCDGANKRKEFQIISQHIKSGDFILAHDYSFDYNYFTEHIYKKIWNWFEIQNSDLEESSIKHNLSPYKPDEFQEIVWGCRIKN